MFVRRDFVALTSFLSFHLTKVILKDYVFLCLFLHRFFICYFIQLYNKYLLMNTSVVFCAVLSSLSLLILLCKFVIISSLCYYSDRVFKHEASMCVVMPSIATTKKKITKNFNCFLQKTYILFIFKMLMSHFYAIKLLKRTRMPHPLNCVKRHKRLLENELFMFRYHIWVVWVKAV